MAVLVRANHFLDISRENLLTADDQRNLYDCLILAFKLFIKCYPLR